MPAKPSQLAVFPGGTGKADPGPIPLHCSFRKFSLRVHQSAASPYRQEAVERSYENINV